MKRINTAFVCLASTHEVLRNFFLKEVLTLTICLIILPTSAFASAGNLDWSFGTDGKVVTSFPDGFNRANSVIVQPDNKILVAGTTYNPTGVYQISVIRYHPNGTIDTNFGNNGKASTSGAAQANVGGVVLQPDGKIIVGATDWSTINGIFKPRFALVRFNVNGTLDTSFDNDGKAIYPTITPDGDGLRGITLQPDGKIVATGQTGNPTPQQVVVLRSNADGSLDTSFDNDGVVITPIGSANIGDFAEDLIIQPDGKIIVIGNGWETGRDILLIRYNTNGSLDMDFGGDGIVTTRIFSQASYGYNLALQPDGKIVVAGQFINAFLVLRYNSNGSLDTTFDNDGFNYTGFGGTRSYPSSIAVQKNGKIIVAGYADSESGSDDFAITRFNTNGALDTSFGSNGKVRTVFSSDRGVQDKVNAITLQPDGKLIAVGEGATYPPSFVVARYLTNSSSIADFDGDDKSDVSVFRPESGVWHLQQSQLNYAAVGFGLSTDKLVPADFDGDGKTDLAVYRENPSDPGKAKFYILHSSNNQFREEQFGATGDIPVAGDWDGDGRADIGVYRAGTQANQQGYFYYRPSSQPNVNFIPYPWGIAGDKPVIADYDGDGKADPAVFRPSNGAWYIQRSRDGFYAIQFGASEDKPVASDYDGDGKADQAVFRPSNGVWYIWNSSTGFSAAQFGVSADKPVPADYDGDGKTDLAVYRDGNWFILNSTNGFAALGFGNPADKPVPNTFVR